MPFIASPTIASNDQELVPTRSRFKIKVTSLEKTTREIFRYHYPGTGIRFTLERTDLSLLLSTFYIPTGVFAMLSLISFLIDPYVVSFCKETLKMTFK